MKMIFKKIVVAIAASLVCGVAMASVMGTLVSSRQGQSVGGQYGWVCTYEVQTYQGEQYVTIWEPNYCPYSMYFN